MLNEFRLRGRLSRAGFWLRHVTIVPIGLWLVIAAGESPSEFAAVLVRQLH